MWPVAGRRVAGPVLAGRTVAGPVLAGPVLAGRTVAGPVLAVWSCGHCGHAILVGNYRGHVAVGQLADNV